MAVVLHHFILLVSVKVNSLSEKNIRGDNITHEKLVTQSFIVENKWSHDILQPFLANNLLTYIYIYHIMQYTPCFNLNYSHITLTFKTHAV